LLVATLGFSLAGPVAALRADAALGTEVFVVNSASLALGNASACTGGGGDCSLRTAITAANGVNGDYDVEIRVAPGLDLSLVFPDNSTTNYMFVGKVSPTDTDGAYFHIKRTMTINLDKRLHTRGSGTRKPATAFFVDAPDVKLLNLSDIYSNESSIIFSANSDGSVLDGGVSIQSANNYAQRMIGILGLADNITIKNYTMGRIHGTSYEGLIRLAGAAESASNRFVNGLTLSNVTMNNTPATAGSTTCTTSSAAGCVSSGLVVAGDMTLTNLVIEHSTFSYFTGSTRAIDLEDAGSGSGNWDIHHNTITEMRAGSSYLRAMLYLPQATALSGTNYIRNNDFDNGSLTTQGFAIHWHGPSSPPAISNLSIIDNYFDGLQTSGIILDATGAVTMRGNRFGTHSKSQTSTSSEATAHGLSTAALLQNYAKTANRWLLTWEPSVATLNASCEFVVQVAPHSNVTNAAQPTPPVTIDFYYTTGATAEVYLGSQSNVSAGPATVPELPPAAGYVRIQTQNSTAQSGFFESSQYSTAIAIPTANLAPCLVPRMTIDLQAWKNVTPGATTYDTIIAAAASGGATEIVSGSMTDQGPEWFTYKVSNTGHVTLRDVVVTDLQGRQACTFKTIAHQSSVGCAAPATP
jgi:hypothetical protein